MIMLSICFLTQEAESPDFTDVPVAILNVQSEDHPPVINTIAIILEGNVVMDNMPDYSAAMCILFGLIYNLHFDYPKGMKNTFEFIQKIIMKMGEQKLNPKIQILKNALLIWYGQVELVFLKLHMKSFVAKQDMCFLVNVTFFLIIIIWLTHNDQWRKACILKI